MEDKKEKFRERLGVSLLCLILIVSGLILIKDKSASGAITENVSQKQNSVSTGSANITASSNNTAEAKNVSGKININKASIEELDTLPRIGEKTAQKIIEYRNSHTNFKTIEEIKEVSGIGDAKYSQIKDLITI
jgi:competence protein ComEA